MTEIFFDKAKKRAAYLDAYYKEHGAPMGPLHGLPIALKDSHNVSGIDSTIGMTAYAFKPEKENSVVVNLLLSLGAVLYVKTMVPQSLMVADSDNFTFGSTRNPWSKNITAAGSSGGLAALIAFKGAVVGIGTDIGGSIRAPAYCNGICGIKPSSGRIPYHLIKGQWANGAETAGILCVNGVLARSSQDCELIMREISRAEPWLVDPGCIYSPWQDVQTPKDPLVIGVIREEGEANLLPPVKRTLDTVAEKIKTAGHEIVELEFYRTLDLSEVAVNFFKVDGGKHLMSVCAQTGEPLTEIVKYSGLYPSEPQNLDAFYAFSATRVLLQYEWLKFWADTAKLSQSGRPIDAILCPVQPFLPHPVDIPLRSHFTRNWNVLDYPCMVGLIIKTISNAKVFQTKLSADMSKDDVDLPAPRNVHDGRVQSTCKFTLIALLHLMLDSRNRRQRYEGFPIALQLVGQRQMEPKLFNTLRIIEDLL